MEFRTIREDEFDAFGLALSNAFGEVEAAEDDVANGRLSIEFDRTFAAFDEGQIVGCAAVYTFSSVTPGGGTVGTAGITWVGVLPTHRRRGVLTELMRRMLDQAAERGEPIATLLASEGQIYGQVRIRAGGSGPIVRRRARSRPVGTGDTIRRADAADDA